ncbi:hypothetical protein GCM10027416_14100 [Okibacterium endophyticum]
MKRSTTIKRSWAYEMLGVVSALFITITVVSHLASSDRSVLLYTDGDSLLNVLVAHSISTGQPQDWAMSSVLFLPEIAVYGLLSLLSLPVAATLTINAVVNFMVLYTSIRYVAGRNGSSLTAVAGSLLAFSAFSALALLESSSSRSSLELASLMATTTYYSATIIGVVLTVGVLWRIADDPRHHLLSRTVLLILISALSTVTNPIYVAWATVPLTVLVIVWAFASHSTRRHAFYALSGMLGGTALGFACRVPFSSMIANSGASYIRPSDWRHSVDYYSALLVERGGSFEGAIALLLVLALIGLAACCSVIAFKRRSAGATLLASASWFVPLAVLVGAIMVGTHASRYLQPVLFMPALSLVLLPSLLPEHVRSRALSRGVSALIGTIGVILIAATALIGAPRLVQSVKAQGSDPSLRCVTQWIDSSGRVGAGQFWTIRAPKAYLDDPRQLVQVDASLNPYHWLVNRSDYRGVSVSFLVSDSRSPAFELPDDVFRSQTSEMISCGTYTITDFGEGELELGQPRS